MVSNRGMIFITYFDLRAAERARDGMHGTQLGRRPIDVHYGLPRPEEQEGRCDADKNQGSIMVELIPHSPISELSLGRMCEEFGEIKSIMSGRGPAEKVVEYYDSRGAALFLQRMDGKPWMGGHLELKWVWDMVDNRLPPPPASDRFKPPPPQHPAPAANDNWGGRDAAPRRSIDGPGFGDGRGGRGDWAGPPGPPSSGRGRSPDLRDRRGSYESYNSGPARPGSLSGPPPGRYPEVAPTAPPPDDRLEQARKVQQLLNSLSSTGAIQPLPPGPPPGASPHARSPYPPRQEYPIPPGPGGPPFRPPPVNAPPPGNFPPFPPGPPPPAPNDRFAPSQPAPFAPYGAPPRGPPVKPYNVPPGPGGGGAQGPGPGARGAPPMGYPPAGNGPIPRMPPFPPKGPQGPGPAQAPGKDVGSLLAMLSGTGAQ
ncbi:hypothetical protein IAT38_003916 [Cryptococcus sp. DSM 104549]